MTANGVVRNYIYGKTLQDTVKVIPSDEGFNYHSGYNGTAGKIPEEGTPEHEIFAMEPYGHVYFGNEEDEDGNFYSVSGNSSPLNVLKKVTTRGCVNEADGMPRAQCIRLSKSDTKNADKKYVYSHRSKRDTIIYGHADFKLSLNYKCECDASGKYKPSFSGKTVNEILEVIQSLWRYDYYDNDWHEHCWKQTDLQKTYEHESQHIKNGRHIAATLNSYAKKNNFNAKQECEKEGQEELKKLKQKWNEWYINEQSHANPSSPKYGGSRNEIHCDDR
jgi:hypothetical protein